MGPGARWVAGLRVDNGGYEWAAHDPQAILGLSVPFLFLAASPIDQIGEAKPCGCRRDIKRPSSVTTLAWL
jgi:hypothetical protein